MASGNLHTYWDRAPDELKAAIAEFWADDHQYEAAAVAYLESGHDAFALRDTRPAGGKCGDPIGERDGVPISAEFSVGYFQINSCNFPNWEWARLYNARHNAGTAHMLWQQAGGWSPWFFSAQALGLG